MPASWGKASSGRVDGSNVPTSRLFAGSELAADHAAAEGDEDDPFAGARVNADQPVEPTWSPTSSSTSRTAAASTTSPAST